MKKITILTVLLVIVVFAMPAYAKDEPKPDDVNVVNPVPLPVTGDVNATVSGDVNVTNEPGVTVLNNDTMPVPVTLQADGLPVNVSTEYRFVGYSADTTGGAAGGLGAMHKYCQNSFGPEARLCMSEEYLKTPWRDPPPEATAYAWIQPTIVATTFERGSDTAHDRVSVTDYSGADVRISAGVPITNVVNCCMWKGCYSGLVVETGTGGLFFIPWCLSEDMVLNVTCCRPVRNGP